MHTDIDNLTGDARRVIANLNDMTGQPNQKRFAEILTNADDMIARLSPKIDQISDQALKLTKEANDAIGQSDPQWTMRMQRCQTQTKRSRRSANRCRQT